MRTLVIGTGNKNKAEEIIIMLSGLPLDIRIAGDYGPFDPDENGKTLEENAAIKAQAAFDLTGEWSIADDTGLFIDALNGEPGICAARYAGKHADWQSNIEKVLKGLDGVPLDARTAKFGCVIALCRPKEPMELFRGKYSGFIATERRGDIEFGYDKIFMMADQNKTFAEITKEEKNAISHRGQAVRNCRERLEKLIW